MSERDVWDGRPVTFAALSILEGEPAIEAFGRGDGKTGRYTLLALSLRWADTEERVFVDADHVRAQPLRNWVTLIRLADKAMFVNGLRNDDPDAPAPTVANGHDTQASAGPSP
jgi:hypothetical protein